jgi:hypothetical protein
MVRPHSAMPDQEGGVARQYRELPYELSTQHHLLFSLVLDSY